MNKRIILVLAPDKAPTMVLGVLPAFRGNDPVDLVCGGCGAVIGSGTSAATLKGLIRSQSALVVKCQCGSHNRLPTTVDH